MGGHSPKVYMYMKTKGAEVLFYINSKEVYISVFQVIIASCSILSVDG